MSLFTTITRFFGNSSTADNKGQQSYLPSHYSISPAINVTEDSALQISVVWACVRLLSETLASLPLIVYERNGDSRNIAGHDLYKILHDQPNARMTSQEFRETMMLNLCLQGNAYARIDRVSGRVVALWPLAAKQMEVSVLPDGELVYAYRRDNDVAIFAEQNILHIKLFGNGTIGLSPLAYARNSIGMAAAAEQYSQAFFSNGGKPSGILSVDKVLTKEQRAVLRERFQSMAEGSENHHRLLVMEAGMKYTPIQINPEDMQMLQTRHFQIEDIARFFGVPSFLINDTEKTTTWGTGIEQMMLGFYQLNLRPYLSRWEQAMKKSLLTTAERSKYDIEFNFEGLLRGNSKGRAEYLSQMVQNGLMTRNEARKKENLPTKPGGDDLTVQVNLTPIDKLGETDANQNNQTL